MQLSLGVLAYLWAQTIYYQQDFNSGVPADWQLNTTDMGGATNGYNRWVVGADYNIAVAPFEVHCPIFGCVPTNPIPVIPNQPPAISGAPQSDFLHVSYDGTYSASNGCTPPNQVTTSFLAADGFCFGGESYFAKLATPAGIFIPAGTGLIKLSFFWICQGGPQSFGEVLYSTNGPNGPWFSLSSSITGTSQLFNHAARWNADTITLPIARPTSLWIAFRFVNNPTMNTSDPPLAVDEIRVFEVPVALPTLTLDNATPNPVCAGNSLTVSFTAQNFPNGTVYTAELLDASNNIVASASGVSPISLPVPSTLPSGTYTLRVRGNTNPPTISNTLSISVVNVQSLACSVNPNPAQVGNSVSLTLAGVNMPSGPFDIQMSPGDGSPLQIQNGVPNLPFTFNHVYNLAGTYTVTFTITHTASGCTGTCQVPVTIQPPTTNTIDLLSINPSLVCAGSSITVNFTPTGTFNAGNLFRVQLSDAGGSFSTPQNIGVGVTSPITATIPGTVASGMYKVRVVSTSPVVVSDTMEVEVVNLSSLSCSYTPVPGVVGSPIVLSLDGSGLPSGPFDISLDADGDGNPDYTQNNVNSLPYSFTHSYSAAGTYTANFILVHPASGCRASCQVSVIVQAPAPNSIDLMSLSPSIVCAGSTFDVVFSVTGNFAMGNVFEVQLSDAGGSFSTPQNIGVGVTSPIT
ncbi:MAG: hypothetical protein NZ933_07390, partial [Bacteroidia bacterium]|nr:hypothetical protein [Bacteroidia bacterium]